MDIIGFDACLMSMYEVASAVAPYSHYLLSSELLEPGQGWDYTALGSVTGLQQSGGVVDAVQVGGLVVRSYMRSSLQAGSVGLTLALTDLGKVPQLQNDLMALARSLTVQMAGTNGNGARLGWKGVGLRLSSDWMKWSLAAWFAHSNCSPRLPLPAPNASQPRLSRCCSSAPGWVQSQAQRKTWT